MGDRQVQQEVLEARIRELERVRDEQAAQIRELERNGTQAEAELRNMQDALGQRVSDRDRMAQELGRSQKLDSLGILAGGLAHDFNNYLLSILGNISLAKIEIEAGHPAYRLLAQSEKASLLAKGLTQQLLTFSKGGQPVTALLGLPDLVKDCTTVALSGSNVTTDYEVEEDLPPIMADKNQVGQVIQNMVTNAIQAMPGGGILTIQLASVPIDAATPIPLAPGRYVRLSMRDHGVGISPEQIDRIFDPYFTTKQQGGGLGLAVCFSIVQKHGGHIAVASTPGKGATFHVYLPAASVPPPRAEKPQGAHHRGTGRVLVMDDEELVLDVASRMLGAFGYKVETAIDGQAAIDRYREAMERDKPFDLVIMDLTVPGGIGGQEAVVRIQELDPEVYAVVSSGYSTDPVMSDYRSYGFEDVLPKPYTLDSLSRVLRDAGAA